MRNNTEKITLVTLFCTARTGHFGMGAFVKNLIEELHAPKELALFRLSMDCDYVDEVRHFFEGGEEWLEIPRPENKLFLTGEDFSIQRIYAQRVVEIAFPYLAGKDRIILLCNTVVHLEICRLLKDMLPAKLVYVHHNFSWKSYVNTTYENYNAVWVRGDRGFHPLAFQATVYQQEIARLADKVVTVTKQAADFFINTLSIETEKVVTIYNGVSTDSLETGLNMLDTKSKFHIENNEKIILFSGRLVKEKGIHYLIKAFHSVLNSLPNTRLLIIGNGDYGEYLKAVSNIWAKVTFTGELPRSMVLELYKVASLGVMPSLQEQCSISAIEMRLSNIPMIVSAVEGMDEVFTDGVDALKVNCYLDENQMIYLSSEELSQKMILLLTDEALAKRLCENGLRKALMDFDSKQMADRYREVFESLFS